MRSTLTTIATLSTALLLSLPLLVGCEATPVEAGTIEPVEAAEADPSPQPNRPGAQPQQEQAQPTAADPAAKPSGCCGAPGCTGKPGSRAGDCPRGGDCPGAQAAAGQGGGCGGGCGCGG